MSGDFWIECVMWPVVIGANILAYYFDYYNHQKTQDDNGEDF